MSRKQHHCLFVEEEVYNWASPRPLNSRRLILFSVLVLMGVFLVGMLR